MGRYSLGRKRTTRRAVDRDVSSETNISTGNTVLNNNLNFSIKGEFRLKPNYVLSNSVRSPGFDDCEYFAKRKTRRR